MIKTPLHNGATFSNCGRYRYELCRSWANRIGKRSTVTFIGLNPSTADAEKNDPTIRRCIRFAQDWHFKKLIVVNLFGWRATLPSDLKKAASPIGELNDHHIEKAVSSSALVIACWGVDGTFLNRAAEVRSRYHRRLQCLRVTKFGEPAHPLYLPAHLTPTKLRKLPQLQK